MALEGRHHHPGGGVIMGVYIKDMKMPDCCAECCFLSGMAIPSGDYICECIDELCLPDDVIVEGRPDWCPLEEIKEE